MTLNELKVGQSGVITAVCRVLIAQMLYVFPPD